ncbi:MAG TPA: hypothetical protein ENJ82_06905 [Bacteroidetes bacterium]|nr:hypothetical protein [Bacteroidota bacterium]
MENSEFNETNLITENPTISMFNPMPLSPLQLVACENFQHLFTGQTYGLGTFVFGNNNLRYTIAYSGGARISTHDPAAPGVHLLEGVEDGAILIEFTQPMTTDMFELELVQAGEPICIRYFSGYGANLLGTTYTSAYNQVQKVTLKGAQLTTILISGPEALLKSVCYGLTVQP